MSKDSSKKMSPEEAKTFDRYSVQNATEVKAAFPCGCLPYISVFTYNRWQALGKQVKKGEHGKALSIIKEIKEVGEDGKETVKKKVHWTRVFCKCQTKPKKEAAQC